MDAMDVDPDPVLSRKRKSTSMYEGQALPMIRKKSRPEDAEPRRVRKVYVSHLVASRISDERDSYLL